MNETILIMLLAFQIKHLVADYYLQYPYMYENKGKAKGWFKPLLDHSLVHTLGTALIVVAYSIFIVKLSLTVMIGLILFDLVTHFITDRWKATRKTDPSQAFFWESLGIDQMVHHTVGILIVFTIAMY